MIRRSVRSEKPKSKRIARTPDEGVVRHEDEEGDLDDDHHRVAEPVDDVLVEAQAGGDDEVLGDHVQPEQDDERGAADHLPDERRERGAGRRRGDRAGGVSVAISSSLLAAEDPQRPDERHERRDDHGRDEERLLAARHEPQADEADADPVEAVDQHPREQDARRGPGTAGSGRCRRSRPRRSGPGPASTGSAGGGTGRATRPSPVSRLRMKARPPRRRPRGSNQPTMPRRRAGPVAGRCALDGRAGHQRFPPNEKRRRARAPTADRRSRMIAAAGSTPGRAGLGALPGQVAAPRRLLVVHEAHDGAGIQRRGAPPRRARRRRAPPGPT